ncbi:MAG: chitobiase/beta-hexosaminidase C-terminal domain-containing protein [Cellulophaga sp.]
MKNFIVVLLLSTLLSCQQKEKEVFASTNSFQLSPPLGRVDSALFKNLAKISLDFKYPEAQIRYTKNGTEVTNNSPLYKGTISTTKSTKIRARVFHPEFASSAEIELQVVQIKKNISTSVVTITPEANANYSGNGSSSLIDLQKGTLQFRTEKKWLGFQSKTVTVDLTFQEETKISKVILSALIDQSGWIFSPSTVSVFSRGMEIGKVIVSSVVEQQPSQLKYIKIPIKKQNYSSLKIKIESLETIPEWHQGKGTSPWLFIDELLVE